MLGTTHLCDGQERTVSGGTLLHIDRMSGHSSSKTAGDSVNMNFAKKEVMILQVALCGGNREDGAGHGADAETGEVEAWYWLPNDGNAG